MILSREPVPKKESISFCFRLVLYRSRGESKRFDQSNRCDNNKRSYHWKTAHRVDNRRHPDALEMSMYMPPLIT